MARNRVRMWIPKWVFWLAVGVNTGFVIIAGLYLFTQFDLPYINSGDKFIVYVVTLLWWALTSLAIIGWKTESS